MKNKFVIEYFNAVATFKGGIHRFTVAGYRYDDALAIVPEGNKKYYLFSIELCQPFYRVFTSRKKAFEYIASHYNTLINSINEYKGVHNEVYSN